MAPSCDPSGSPGAGRDGGIVLEVVKQYREALCYAASDFQSDRDVARAAVNQTGDAVQFPSVVLQTALQIVGRTEKGFRGN